MAGLQLHSPSSLRRPPAQALCENLLWPPPERSWSPPGVGETMSPPSHERQVFAKSNAISV